MVNSKLDYSTRILSTDVTVALCDDVFIFFLQVGTVSATDPDEGGNGQFRYSIESGDPDDQFTIDGMNTFLFFQMNITFENA